MIFVSQHVMVNYSLFFFCKDQETNSIMSPTTAKNQIIFVFGSIRIRCLILKLCHFCEIKETSAHLFLVL